MAKVYRGNGWEIREGRWQDSAPESVDVVISDPPYDARTHKNGRRGVGGPGRGSHATISETADKSFGALTDVEMAQLATLTELAQRWVVLFCAVEQLGRYQEAAGPCYIRSGIWSRPSPAPQFTGDRPGHWGDGVAIMHRKGQKRWNGGGKPARWRHNHHGVGACDARVHETQKPVPLMLDLVRLFSDPGELVWDPYCGSGTTGVACLRLGRRFLGAEMQPHYAKIAAERLAAEERGLTLRDVRRGQTSIFDAIEGK